MTYRLLCEVRAHYCDQSADLARRSNHEPWQYQKYYTYECAKAGVREGKELFRASSHQGSLFHAAIHSHTLLGDITP